MPDEEAEKPDRRVVEWTGAWQRLYEKELPIAEHNAERDVMLAWARERGEIDVCLKGQGRSRSFHEKLSPEDLAFVEQLPFGSS